MQRRDTDVNNRMMEFIATPKNLTLAMMTFLRNLRQAAAALHQGQRHQLKHTWPPRVLFPTATGIQKGCTSIHQQASESIRSKQRYSHFRRIEKNLINSAN